MCYHRGMNQPIRDNNGRLIGLTRDNGHGSQSVYDGNGSFVGSTNQTGTKDAQGRIVTWGSQNPGLLIPRK